VAYFFGPPCKITLWQHTKCENNISAPSPDPLLQNTVQSGYLLRLKCYQTLDAETDESAACVPSLSERKLRHCTQQHRQLDRRFHGNRRQNSARGRGGTGRCPGMSKDMSHRTTGGGRTGDLHSSSTASFPTQDRGGEWRFRRATTGHETSELLGRCHRSRLSTDAVQVEQRTDRHPRSEESHVRMWHQTDQGCPHRLPTNTVRYMYVLCTKTMIL